MLTDWRTASLVRSMDERYDSIAAFTAATSSRWVSRAVTAAGWRIGRKSREKANRDAHAN